MASQGPLSPSTAVDDASIGTQVWANPGNVTTSNDVKASANLASAGNISHYLKTTGYGATVPTGSTIMGVKVEVERSQQSGSQRAYDYSIKIVKGGVIGGTDKSAGAAWPLDAADAYATYGGPADMWGLSLTPADVNASNFGAAVSVWHGGISFSETAYSDHIRITIYYTPPNTAPNAPTLGTIAAFDATEAKVFPWAFSDPDAGDAQSAYQLIITRVSDGATILDSGKVVSATASRTVAGATLTNGVAYQWKVRTWDGLDVVGPYSPLGNFSTAEPPTVTITAPATDGTIINTSSMLVEWTVSDPGSTGQSAYRVVVKNSSGVEQSNTGKLASTTIRGHNVTGLLNNVTGWSVEVTAWNGSDVASAVTVRTFDVSFTSPPQPVVTITPQDSGGYIDFLIDNPVPEVSRQVTDGVTTNADATVTSATAAFTAADVGKAIAGAGIPAATTILSVTNGTTIEMSANATATATGVTLTIGTDEPVLASNSLYRREQGTVSWIRIAAGIVSDGGYRDYTPGSGIVYEYWVTAIATNGTTAASEVAIDSLTLIGIWLHDPSDAEATAQGFRATARNKQRGRTRTRQKVFHNFAGRELPVAEIGEQLAISLAITLHIYDDATMELLRDLDERDTTLCYRDSRGRRHFGMIVSLPEDDELFGYSVAFSFVATDHSEAV